jgi:hypothetical protein
MMLLATRPRETIEKNFGQHQIADRGTPKVWCKFITPSTAVERSCELFNRHIVGKLRRVMHVANGMRVTVQNIRPRNISIFNTLR